MVVISFVIFVLLGCSTVRTTELQETLVSSEKVSDTLPAPMVTFSPDPTAIVVSITPTVHSMTPTIGRITNKEFEDLLQYSRECRLPCWWGIEPGKTSSNQANQLLITHGINLIGSRSEKSDTVIRDYGFDLYTPDLVFNDIEIYSSDKLITMMHIKAGSNHNEAFWEVWSTFLPKLFIKNYDPGQIQMMVDSQHPSKETGNVIYRLLFLFSENQTIIEYRGLTKEINGGYKICPRNSIGGNLSPAITISIGNLEEISKDFLPLDVVSGEKLDNIKKGIQTSENYCITVKRALLP